MAGVTRNLTPRFIELRIKQKRLRERTLTTDSAVDLLPEGQTSSSTPSSPRLNQTGPLPPKLAPLWVDRRDKITESIERIEAQIAELRRLHASKLRTTFDSDSKATDRKMSELNGQILAMIRRTDFDIKTVRENDGEDDAEVRVSEAVALTFSKKLFAVTTAYRAMQREYDAEVQGIEAKVSGGALQGAIDTSSPSAGAGAAEFTAEQKQQMANGILDAQGHAQAVDELFKSVGELADIFRDLAALIVDQGTILDRIDYNLECAVERTQSGVKELIKSEKEQRKAGSRAVRCIACMMLVITILGEIIILKNFG